MGIKFRLMTISETCARRLTLRRGTLIFASVILLGWMSDWLDAQGAFGRDTIVYTSNQERVTPAVLNPSSHRNLQLTRLEFNELRLRMVGMATFPAEAVAFIQHPGRRNEMTYKIGDVIGGFRIVSIQTDYVVFERGGMRFWLAAGQMSYEDSGEAEAIALEMAQSAVDLKRRNMGLKTRTRAYAAARIIHFVRSDQKSRVWENNSRVEYRVTSSGKRFVVPLPGRVSSRFGYRKAPMGGARKYHRGVDIAAPNKTPILSMADGEVLKVSRSWAKGLNILIRHADGFSTAYFHLSKAKVQEGQWVHQGEIIGNEGSTGQSTGPHLHFEIHKNGVPVDPGIYLPEVSRR